MFLFVSSSPPIAWIRSWLKTNPPNTSVGPGTLNPAAFSFGLQRVHDFKMAGVGPTIDQYSPIKIAAQRELTPGQRSEHD